MITEDYVSFETAKLLKERGFDGECRDYYNIDGHFYSEDFKSNWNFGKGAITIFSAPTLQMAMKWLREKHNIFLSIQQHMDMSYVWYTYANGIPRGCDRESHNNSYEEACDAAIKYCLENLI